MLKTSGLLHPDDRQDELKQVEVYKSHSKFMKTKVECLCMPPRTTLQCMTEVMHVCLKTSVTVVWEWHVHVACWHWNLKCGVLMPSCISQHVCLSALLRLSPVLLLNCFVFSYLVLSSWAQNDFDWVFLFLPYFQWHNCVVGKAHNHHTSCVMIKHCATLLSVTADSSETVNSGPISLQGTVSVYCPAFSWQEDL